MFRNLYNQKGFSLIGIILVVVIIIALGYGSLFIYKENSESKKIKSNLENTLDSFEKAKEDIGKINEKVEEINEFITETVKDKEENKEGWLIFENEEYGYEIMYPESWFVYYDTISCGENDLEKIDYKQVRFLETERSRDCGSSGSESEKGLYVNIGKNIDTLVDSIDEVIGNDPTKKLFRGKDIVIGDIEGEEFFFTYEGVGTGRIYKAIEKDDKVYYFTGNFDDKIVSKVLSTFRFTN